MKFFAAPIAILLLVLADAFLACRPPSPPDRPPVPTPPPGAVDGGEGVVALAACERLAAIGCPEGLDSDCTYVLESVMRYRLVDFNVGCLRSARTREDVRACSPLVECK